MAAKKRKTRKRRSAAQIAATKKLVAFNKKRRGKKKTKRKVSKRRATNPARKTKRRTAGKTRTTDYVVFRCVNGRVGYLKAVSPSAGVATWTGERYEALHWTAKKVAERWARKLGRNPRVPVGVAGSGTSKSQIKAVCLGKT